MSIREIDRQNWPVRFRGNFRHLYVVQEEESGPVKVGIAANAFWRINELQVGNPRRLYIRAVFEGGDKRAVFLLEQRVQERLSDYHIGGEWYSYPPEQVISIIAEELK